MAASRSSKLVYNSLRKRGNYSPKACLKWEQEFLITETEWKKIFSIPFQATISPRVKYFQYRFLHRFIGVNSYTYKIGLSSSPLCTFCRLSSETVDHLFWDCPLVQTFWINAKCICVKSFVTFHLDKRTIFFGLTKDINHPINTFILQAKFFIFNCKVNASRPDATTFYQKFTFYLRVNDHIFKKKNPGLGVNDFVQFFNLPPQVPI